MSKRTFLACAGVLALCVTLWVGGFRPDSVEPEPAPPETPPMPSTPPVPPGAAWNTYHGDAGLQGVAEGTLPNALGLRWRFLAGAPVYTTPVALDGRIHFASAKGEVFALDIEGQRLWSHQLVFTGPEGKEMPDRVDAPVACFEGKVFAGTARGILYALDAAAGAEIWRADIGAPILGTPNFLPASEGPGRVYALGQSDAALRCYNAATGALLFTSEAIDRCDACPAIAPGVAAFGSCAAALHLISPETGALLHSIPIDEDSQVAGGAAIADGVVYVGCRSGKVMAADPVSGTFRWSSAISELEVFATPAVSGQWLVTAAYDGFVYGLDRASGEKRWQFEAGGEPSSPVIAGGKVLVGSGGTLYMLRLEDGAMTWSEKAADAISSPAVAYGLVVLGMEDGAVAAYGAI